MHRHNIVRSRALRRHDGPGVIIREMPRRGRRRPHPGLVAHLVAAAVGLVVGAVDVALGMPIFILPALILSVAWISRR